MKRLEATAEPEIKMKEEKVRRSTNAQCDVAKEKRRKKDNPRSIVERRC